MHDKPKPAQIQKKIGAQQYVENSYNAYKQGLQIAYDDLHPCNSIRLGITLNMAVFYREVKQDQIKAICLL